MSAGPGDRLDPVCLCGRAAGRGPRHPRRPGSPAKFAAALNRVLADAELRDAIGRRAYAYSRNMVWSEVGAEYRRLFERVAAPASVVARTANLTAINA